MITTLTLLIIVFVLVTVFGIVYFSKRFEDGTAEQAEEYISNEFTQNEPPVNKLLTERIKLSRSRSITSLKYESLKEQLDYFRRKSADKAELLEKLLLQLLPAAGLVKDYLHRHGSVPCKAYDNIAVGCIELINFSSSFYDSPPDELAASLQDIFTTFDLVCRKFDLIVIRSSVHGYLFCSNYLSSSPASSDMLIESVLIMIECLKRKNSKSKVNNWQLRSGIAVGRICSGMIGGRQSHYDIVGLPADEAQTLMHNCIPMQVNVTGRVKELNEDSYNYKRRGSVRLKGRSMLNYYSVEEGSSDVISHEFDPDSI